MITKFEITKDSNKTFKELQKTKEFHSIVKRQVKNHSELRGYKTVYIVNPIVDQVLVSVLLSPFVNIQLYITENNFSNLIDYCKVSTVAEKGIIQPIKEEYPELFI